MLNIESVLRGSIAMLTLGLERFFDGGERGGVLFKRSAGRVGGTKAMNPIGRYNKDRDRIRGRLENIQHGNRTWEVWPS